MNVGFGLISIPEMDTVNVETEICPLAKTGDSDRMSFKVRCVERGISIQFIVEAEPGEEFPTIVNWKIKE